MTKHDGRYYLQYGAPGTEFNVYANGTYVSDNRSARSDMRLIIRWLTARRVRQARATDRPSGTIRQLVEHGHKLDWIQLGHRAADRDASGQILRRWSVRGAHRGSAISLNYVPTHEGSTTRTDCSPAGCCCPTAKPVAASLQSQASSRTGAVTDEDPRTFWVAASKPPGETLTSISVRRRRCAQCRSTSPTTSPGVSPMRLTSTPSSSFKLARRPDLAAVGSHRTAATRPPNAYFELPRPVRPASSAMSMVTLGRRTLPSATSGCSAMPMGGRRRRLRVCPPRVTQTSAMLRSVGEGSWRRGLQYSLRHTSGQAHADPPALGR